MDLLTCVAMLCRVQVGVGGWFSMLCISKEPGMDETVTHKSCNDSLYENETVGSGGDEEHARRPFQLVPRGRFNRVGVRIGPSNSSSVSPTGGSGSFRSLPPELAGVCPRRASCGTVGSTPRLWCKATASSAARVIRSRCHHEGSRHCLLRMSCTTGTTGTSITVLRSNWESRWSDEQSGPWESLCTSTGMWTTLLVNCNCGT